MLRGIRSRLLFLVCATVIPFIALIGAALWTQWRDDRASAGERATVEARMLAAQVDDHLHNLESFLAGLSHSVSFDPARTEANDTLLRQVKSDMPAFISHIAVYALDGTNIGVADGSRANAAHRLYFQRVFAGRRFAIGDVIREPSVGKKWVLTVARPINDASGELRAVLAIGTMLEHFQDTLRLRQLPPGSIVRVISERNLIIAHNGDPRWIGRDLNSPFQLASDDAPGEPDTSEHIVGTANAMLAPWTISVGLPRDIAYAAVSSRLTWGIALSALAVTIAFVVAGVLSRRIVRPLRQLRQDALVLAGGDLAHRSKVQTQDEIGVLAQSFNGMALALEQRQAEAERATAQLRHLAHYDQLTGLRNRASLRKFLGDRLDAGQPAAIALFDLDGFKGVNDTLGHSGGDALLVEVARRFTKAVGERGLVFRLGGDEFVLVMAEHEEGARVADVVADMLRSLEKPLVIDGRSPQFGGSAGIAMAPRDGATIDQLLANADIALYQVKAAGGRTHHFYGAEAPQSQIDRRQHRRAA